MKQFFFVAFSVILFNNCIAQSWTKGDRENVYSECIGNMGKYENVTKEQKESFCICYLTEATKIAKVAYDNMIEIELKKFKETTMISCSKSLGIDLNASPMVEEKKTESKSEISRDAILGHWRDDESEFWLEDSGNYTIVYNGGKRNKGTWSLDGALLMLQKDKALGLIKSEKTFKILMFASDHFVFTSISGKDTHNAYRVIKK